MGQKIRKALLVTAGIATVFAGGWFARDGINWWQNRPREIQRSHISLEEVVGNIQGMAIGTISRNMLDASVIINDGLRDYIFTDPSHYSYTDQEYVAGPAGCKGFVANIDQALRAGQEVEIHGFPQEDGGFAMTYASFDNGDEYHIYLPGM